MMDDYRMWRQYFNPVSRCARLCVVLCACYAVLCLSVRAFRLRFCSVVCQDQILQMRSGTIFTTGLIISLNMTGRTDGLESTASLRVCVCILFADRVAVFAGVRTSNGDFFIPDSSGLGNHLVIPGSTSGAVRVDTLQTRESCPAAIHSCFGTGPLILCAAPFLQNGAIAPPTARAVSVSGGSASPVPLMCTSPLCVYRRHAVSFGVALVLADQFDLQQQCVLALFDCFIIPDLS
jgi:hypothetical protein